MKNVENNSVRLCEIINLMSDPHYRLFVPPVRTLMSLLMVNNKGYTRAVYHHYSLHYLYNMTSWQMRIWPESPLSCCKYADHYSVPIIWQLWNVTGDWEIVVSAAERKKCENVNNSSPAPNRSFSSLMFVGGGRSTLHHYNEGGSIRQGLQWGF